MGFSKAENLIKQALRRVWQGHPDASEKLIDFDLRAWGPSPLLCLYGLRARIVARSICPFALPSAVETQKIYKGEGYYVHYDEDRCENYKRYSNLFFTS